MSTLTVTARGQVTLGRDALHHLGISRGEKLEVSKLPGGRLEIRAARGGGSIGQAFGILSDPSGKCASLEEIADAAAAGWAGRR